MGMMQIKGIPLVKFKNEEIIDSLQSGCIYMNKLDLFRKMEQAEDDDKVGDNIDGLLHLHEAIIHLPELGESQEVHNQGIKTKYSNDYCYCFFSFQPGVSKFEFSDVQKSKMEEMGDWALIITDFDKFLERLKEKAEAQGFEVYHGFARYFDPNIDSGNVLFSLLGEEGLKNVSFLKRNKYSYQQEYRFVLHKDGAIEDKVILQIGDISDISVKIKSKKVLEGYIKKADSIEGSTD